MGVAYWNMSRLGGVEAGSLVKAAQHLDWLGGLGGCCSWWLASSWGVGWRGAWVGCCWGGMGREKAGTLDAGGDNALTALPGGWLAGGG